MLGEVGGPDSNGLPWTVQRLLEELSIEDLSTEIRIGTGDLTIRRVKNRGEVVVIEVWQNYQVQD